MIVEFSGIDGSGKSTQVHQLTRWATDHRLVAVECPLRSQTRRICQGIAAGAGLQSWREIFRADRVEFSSAVDLVQQAMTSIVLADAPGHVLVADQYLRTWVARSAAGGPGLQEQVSRVYAKLPDPAVSFHLTLDPGTAWQRIIRRPKGDHTLRAGGLRRLTETAEALEAAVSASPYPCTVLDGTRPVDELAAQVRQSVRTALIRSGVVLPGARQDTAR